MAKTKLPDGVPFRPHVTDSERFLVSFEISEPYCDEITTIEEAAAYALAFTRDAKSDGAVWIVTDTQTGERWAIEQADMEPLIDERDMLR